MRVGVGNGTPLQYSGLESSRGRRAWQAIYSPWGHEFVTAEHTHKNLKHRYFSTQ